ncbi:MAG: efflux RND transporter periplasmic adaptor subunit [bacterium]
MKMPLVLLSMKLPLQAVVLSVTLACYTAANAAGIIKVNAAESGTMTVLGSTVIPYKEVTLSAQLPGRMKVVNGEVGSVFSTGHVLAEIDAPSIMAKRQAVLAQINTAQNALRNAQTQYQREVISPSSKDVGNMPGFGLPAMMDIFMTRPMADAMGTTDTDFGRYSDLMNRASGVSQAEGAYQQAVAQLNEIDTNLRDAKSIAPFEGMITKKMVEVGDIVQPGQPLMVFGQVNYLRLKADVPSGLVPYLSTGMDVMATIDGVGNVTARVAQIYPIADPQRHTVVVKFDLPIGTKAAPGVYAEVKLPSAASKGNKMLSIPESAVLRGRSLPSVLAVTGDNRSELRLIRLGTKLGNGQVEVVSGLTADDRIIDNPPAGVSSGWMPK